MGNKTLGILATVLALSVSGTELAALQSVQRVTCGRAACPRTITVEQGRPATLQLDGDRLDALTRGEVVDANGSPVGAVRVELVPLARRTGGVPARGASGRQVTLTYDGGAVPSSTGLQLRFATTSGRPVTAPVTISIPAAPVTTSVPVARNPSAPVPSRSTPTTTVSESLPPDVDSADPAVLTLGPRETGTIELSGSNLNKLDGAWVVDDGGRRVYHVIAELQPGTDSRRVVRLTVPDNAHQAGPFGTPLTIMVTEEPGSPMPTPGRVEVPPMFDLYISSCSIVPSTTYGRYRGSVTVRNHGVNTVAASLPAGSSILRYSPRTDGGGYRSASAPNGGLYLAPNAEWTHEIGWLRFDTDPPPSTLSISIPPRDEERNHGNNERSCSVPPQTQQPPQPEPLADLVVSNVTVTPTSGPPSTTFTVTVTVRNQGEAAVTREGLVSNNTQIPVWVRCSIPDDIEYLYDLAPGESRDIIIRTTTPLTPGEKTTDCSIDDTNKVEESNEGNNSRSASFVVTEPGGG